MRKVGFLSFFVLILTSVLFTSCEKDGESGAALPFSIEIAYTSADNFVAKVSPSAAVANGKFVVGVVAEDYYNEELGSEAALVDYITGEVVAKGGSFVRVDDRYIFNSNCTAILSDAWNIEGGTKYIVAAFGVSPSGAATTKVAQKRVATDEIFTMGDGTLVITPSDQSATNIKVTVEKSSDAPFSVYCVAPVSERDLKSRYNNDVAKFASSFALELYEGGYDFTKPDNRYVFNKSAALNLCDFWDMESVMTYYIVAFGVDIEGKIKGEVACRSTSTTPFEAGYSFAVNDVASESYTISMNVMPQNMVGNYCVYALSKSDIEKAGINGDYNLATTIRDILYYSGEVSFSRPDDKYVFNGTNDVTVEKLRSKTDYTVAIFGISSMGNITSEVICVDATTKVAPTVTGSLTSIEVTETYPKSFDIKIDKGDFSSNYFVGIYSKEDFIGYCDGNMNTLATYFMEDELKLGTDLTLVDNVWIFDESTTFNSQYSWFCNPGTAYIIIAFGVDAEGGVTSNIVYTYATTEPVVPSENEITLSVHGITSNAATLQAVTTNDDVYYFGYVEQAKADAMSDAELVDYIEDECGTQLFKYFLSKGDNTRYTGSGLKPSSNYCAVAYGWDSALSTELHRVPFTTLADVAAPAIPSEIVVSEEAFGEVVVSDLTYESYHLLVEPAVEAMEYVQIVTSASDVKSLTSDEKIVKYALKKMSTAGAAINDGGDIYDAWGDFVKPLPCDADQRAGVEANTDYAIIVFGIDKATLQPTTQCVVKKFSTPATAFAPAAKSAASEVVSYSPLQMKVK